MFDVNKYRSRNPWVIQNVQNSQANCGRFPTREQAEEAGRQYRGGVVSVSESQKVVYVSDIPSL